VPRTCDSSAAGARATYRATISVVLAANADQYIAGLTAFRSGDVAEWCSIFSEATQNAASRAAGLGTKLQNLKSEWLESAGSPRRGSAARRLVEGLSAHPLLSVVSASQLLGVSEEAARVALNQLAERGVLRQITAGRRNRAWAADDLFDLLDEFDLSMASLEEGQARPAPTRQLRSQGLVSTSREGCAAPSPGSIPGTSHLSDMHKLPG
jgi:hypothetical protein